eukprot:TRINITY_DN1328_c0_g1_i1.p1 TRINITY_DN1328_c0_g1~~TRINITY_DN1328_c0_g1_i1.p1  ORF type:complete len:121 (+),score=16.88 TRINITY_DN1328_c0_g1_i1:37-363(+)
MTVEADVEKVFLDFHAAKKPIGLCCISPVIAAKLFPKVRLTIGNDKDTAAGIEKMGAVHAEKKVTEAVVDKPNLIVTAPAYMYGSASIWEVYSGIGKMVTGVLKLLKK